MRSQDPSLRAVRCVWDSVGLGGLGRCDFRHTHSNVRQSQKPVLVSILRPRTPAWSKQPLETGQRRWLMVDQSDKAARLLVRALYYATDGELRWWVLPTNLNDLTKEAIAVAVARGWMLDRGDSVCLTDAGRDVVRQG